jgi:hypothetical protein
VNWQMVPTVWHLSSMPRSLDLKPDASAQLQDTAREDRQNHLQGACLTTI